MYPNPNLMQRPPTMMTTAPMSQPNMTMGVPTMRPMVVPSPMPASMIPQGAPSTMMVRPVGSPYAVVNRAVQYDKNKRSTYSNDLRQQQMPQSGQPMPMAYANVMNSNQTMMPGTVPANAASMRQ
jgi:hypothetical protein